MKVRKTFTTIGIVLLAALAIFLLNRRKDNISIEPLKNYALTCKPCEDELKNTALRDTGAICYRPPTPPEDVLSVLRKRKIDEAYKKWVLLVYLKLFEKQLILYRQSFEVRDSPYFLKRFTKSEGLNNAFCEIIGEGVYKRKLGPEFLPASKASEFIEEHRLFVSDADIQHEMNLIDSLINQINIPDTISSE